MQRWDPNTDKRRCQKCGSQVTPQFRRGFGDQEDVAHRCSTCDSFGRLAEGSAAGQHVPHPDPLNDPTRFDCSLEDLPERVRALINSTPVATDGGEER